MPVQIGAKTHNFTDPTGLLSDCHRRIEMFMATLAAVAAVIDRPAEKDTARALESALRYFGEAAPKHTADEEVSLFPRLRQMSHPEVDSALAEMKHLEDEHRWAAPLHEEVERLGVQYLSTGKLRGIDVENFRNAITSLSAMYKRHISMEDELVFPLAARMLSAAEKSAIAKEMANRREVRLVPDATTVGAGQV
jgi:hemerythrin-like domain-containing protein